MDNTMFDPFYSRSPGFLSVTADQDAIGFSVASLSHLLCLSTRSRRWRLVDGPHADLPSITLTNKNR